MHSQTSSTRRIANRRTNAEAGIDLTKRRRWYTEGDGQQNQNGGSNGNSSSAGTQNTEHMIPKTRFDEVNQAKLAAEAKLKEFQDAQAAAEQARLTEQGQFKTIAEQARQEADALKPFKERAEAYEKAFRASNDARIARVPEAMRSLIPTTLPPHEVSAYLDANWELLTATRAPDLDAGAGGGSGGGTQVQVTEADKQQAAAANAQGYKLTPEQVAARRKKQR
jgi:hypothetical protein